MAILFFHRPGSDPPLPQMLYGDNGNMDYQRKRVGAVFLLWPLGKQKSTPA